MYVSGREGEREADLESDSSAPCGVGRRSRLCEYLYTKLDL